MMMGGSIINCADATPANASPMTIARRLRDGIAPPLFGGEGTLARIIHAIGTEVLSQGDDQNIAFRTSTKGKVRFTTQEEGILDGVPGVTCHLFMVEVVTMRSAPAPKPLWGERTMPATVAVPLPRNRPFASYTCLGLRHQGDVVEPWRACGIAALFCLTRIT